MYWTGSNSQYKTDSSNTSFIFSLSHKDKFILQSNGYAIYDYYNDGLKYGNGYDIFISSKSNENNDSFAKINTSYFNSNYIKGDKDSW